MINITMHPRDHKTILLMDLTTFASNIRLVSRIPGGFMTATFTLGLPYAEAVRFQRRYLMCYVRIREQGTLIWEGRIEDMEVTADGLAVTCAGYFSHLNDRIYEQDWFAADAETSEGTQEFTPASLDRLYAQARLCSDLIANMVGVGYGLNAEQEAQFHIADNNIWQVGDLIQAVRQGSFPIPRAQQQAYSEQWRALIDPAIAAFAQIDDLGPLNEFQTSNFAQATSALDDLATMATLKTYSLNPNGLPPTIPNIIKDALDLCELLHISREEIDPDGEIDDEYPVSFSEQAVQVGDAITQLLQYGDVNPTPRPVRFAIWDWRIPYLWVTDLRKHKWRIRRRDIASGSLSLAVSRTDLANRIKVIYSDENGERLYYPPDTGLALTVAALDNLLVGTSDLISKIASFIPAETGIPPVWLNPIQQETIAFCEQIIWGLHDAFVAVRAWPLPMGIGQQRGLVEGWLSQTSILRTELQSLSDEGTLNDQLTALREETYASLSTLEEQLNVYLPAPDQDSLYTSGFLEDMDSQELYGVLDRYITMSGIDDIYARAMGEAALDDMRQPQFTSSFTITGHAYGVGGERYPLWRIRAGDVILIEDLLPAISHLFHYGRYSDTFSMTRIIEVEEASYDVATRTLEVTPAGRVSKLDIVQALGSAGSRGI